MLQKQLSLQLLYESRPMGDEPNASLTCEEVSITLCRTDFQRHIVMQVSDAMKLISIHT